MDKERLLQNTRLLARKLEMTPRELVERGIIAREDYEAIASYDEEKIALLAVLTWLESNHNMRPYRTTMGRAERAAP